MRIQVKEIEKIVWYLKCRIRVSKTKAEMVGFLEKNVEKKAIRT